MNRELQWIKKAIEELAVTAVREDGTYWRATYTPEDEKGVRLLQSWLEEKGFTTYFDAVGNLFGRIEGNTESVILAASHRDTVKDGGKYDGALGILTAIEALSALTREYGKPQKTVEVAALCEEEATRFLSGFIGSRAITGELTDSDLEQKDDEGVTVREAISAAGYYHGALPRKRTDIEHVVELHIEQGAVLENREKKVGLVTSIVGLTAGHIVFCGQQNHAGTTPMSMRSDPTAAAAGLISHMLAWAKAKEDRLVCTFGNIKVEPGKSNIIPGRIDLMFDLRASEQELIDEGKAEMEAFLSVLSQRGDNVSGRIEYFADDPPAELDPAGLSALRQLADEAGYSYLEMPSGAGHDSQIFAVHYATNMVFLPSHRGISHAPAEYTDIDAAAEGYELYKKFLHYLAW